MSTKHARLETEHLKIGMSSTFRNPLKENHFLSLFFETSFEAAPESREVIFTFWW